MIGVGNAVAQLGDEAVNPKASFESRRRAVKQAAARVGVITQVPRVTPLEAGAFRAFAKGGVPFVMVGMVAQWPLAKVTPELLKLKFGDVRVRARAGDYVEAAFSKERVMEELSLSEYLDQAQGTSETLPPYLGNQAMPMLESLCRWPDYFDKTSKPRIWLGPAGTVTPLHCDYDDNLFAQIWRSKRFVLYPPHHSEFLYTRKINPVLFGSDFDPEAPNFRAMPMARRATKVECVVKPGEMLLLPAGWFHHVRAIEFSLSANLWGKDCPLAARV